jgi:hypothetical protein
MLLKTPTTYYYAVELISVVKNEHYPQTVSHALPTWDVTTIAIKIVPCQSKLMDGDIPHENVRRLVPNVDFYTLVVSGGVSASVPIVIIMPNMDPPRAAIVAGATLVPSKCASTNLNLPHHHPTRLHRDVRIDLMLLRTWGVLKTETNGGHCRMRCLGRVLVPSFVV